MDQVTREDRRRGWRRTSSTQPVFTLKTIVILVAVVLAWTFALSNSDRLRPPNPDRSGTEWAPVCPDCGVVESVSLLPSPLDPRGSAPQPYRLIIRMADGSVLQLERPTPLVPGAQVRVQGRDVQPLAPPAGSAAQRQ